ncbi:MAG: hypothetical protein A3K77_00515 [Euryarchaeota archaeon RBG_13_31_8]|nr:MAG: hypothetical protein A3K77_00515 [Euryarchaeota archaeon RBG_13_31_8]
MCKNTFFQETLSDYSYTYSYSYIIEYTKQEINKPNINFKNIPFYLKLKTKKQLREIGYL